MFSVRGHSQPGNFMIFFVSEYNVFVPVVSSFSILGNFILKFSDAYFFSLACFVFHASFSNNASFFSSLTCLLFSNSQGTQREHLSKILQMSPAFSDRFISVDCSDTLADNLSWRKFSKRLLYSPNLLTAVGFTKILS